MSDVFEAIPSQDDRPKDVIGRFLFAWSKLSALCGVLVLVGICLLSTVSIIGHWLFAKPITGDVELVQIGVLGRLLLFAVCSTQKRTRHR